MNKNAMVGGIAAVVLVVVGFAGYKYMELRGQAAKWSGPIAEIEKESFKKDGSVATTHFESVLAAPLAKVQDALWKVEESAGKIENVKLSKLVKQDGNTKVVDMQVQALNLPIQAYTMEFTLHAQEHKVAFKTIQFAAQDIVGSYRLEASPDGTRTRLIYDATATDKMAMPVPQSVIESASKEMFTQMVRGVKKMAQ